MLMAYPVQQPNYYHHAALQVLQAFDLEATKPLTVPNWIKVDTAYKALHISKPTDVRG